MKKNYPYVHYVVMSGICAVLVFLAPACDLGFVTNLTDLSSSDSSLKDASSTTTDVQTGNATMPVPPLLKSLDADQNGELSATEIDNAPAALLTLDTNGDGIITRDELCPARPESSETVNSGQPPMGSGPQNGQGMDRPFGPPSDPLMTALDTDKDGQLSATEIDNAPAALRTLDANGDGILNQDEIRPEKRGQPPVPPILKALDADTNGELSATEIDNAPATLRTLDTNGDGIITRDELCPSRPEISDADNSGQPPIGPGPQNRQGIERPFGPPSDPLMAALDTDQNGELSSTEIDNAPAALRTLDANSDGILTQDEIHPKKVD